MEVYRAETVIAKTGMLSLHGLPFSAGESVEVIVLSRQHAHESSEQYSLRGTPIHYVDPCESVAETDWAALR